MLQAVNTEGSLSLMEKHIDRRKDVSCAVDAGCCVEGGEWWEAGDGKAHSV